MAYGDIIGYVASALVFATFYVRTMMPLRMLAIASNIAFITYSASEGLTPVLVLHSVLLPVNLARLYEIKKLLAFTRSAPRGMSQSKPCSLSCASPQFGKVNTCSGKATTRGICTI